MSPRYLQNTLLKWSFNATSLIPTHLLVDCIIFVEDNVSAHSAREESVDVFLLSLQSSQNEEDRFVKGSKLQEVCRMFECSGYDETDFVLDTLNSKRMAKHGSPTG